MLDIRGAELVVAATLLLCGCGTPEPPNELLRFYEGHSLAVVREVRFDGRNRGRSVVLEGVDGQRIVVRLPHANYDIVAGDRVSMSLHLNNGEDELATSWTFLLRRQP